MFRAIRALGVAAAVAAAGCAAAPPGVADLDALGVSPRAECARAEAIIYFTEASPTLQPTTQPLLRDLLARGDACVAAGGEVRGIVVVSHPDPDASSWVRREQITQRNEQVREALAELGAPADRIRLLRADAHDGEMMARRTEVTLYLY